MAFKEKKISIKELNLWDENARFPDEYYNSDGKELIEYFLSRPSFKIKELIEEIVKDFDLPQLEKIVVWESDKKLIVLEGNRRLTGYKLLVNPELVLSLDGKLYKLLQEKQKEISITSDFQLECLISDEKEQCFRFIDRKHSKGNNEVGWLEPERINYSKRRGYENQNEVIKIAITNFVKGLDLPEEVKNQVLGKGFVTTFYRLVTTGSAKESYGLSTDEKGVLTYKDEEFPDKLKVIIHNVLKKEDFKGNKVDTRELNKNAEIKKYLDSVDAENASKVERDFEVSTQEDIFGKKDVKLKIGGKTKILPKSTNRKYLIPTSCRITISETKINNIYHELRNALLLDDSNKAVPNAIGVLFRVFLEISIDYLLEKEGVTLPKDTKLSGKITKCTEILELKDVASKKQLSNIRKVATDKNHLLNIQNFHDYIHSYKTQPTSSDLKLKWDNLEEFFQIIWNYSYEKAEVKKYQSLSKLTL